MTGDELIRLHIGNLFVQVASLQAENAQLREELEKYKPKDNKVVDLPVKKG